MLIYKNDNPGEVTTQGLAQGPGPNGGTLGADNPTLHATVGWDWLPTIRGRGIGIYGNVYLTYSGSVSLLDPWMETELEIKQVSSSFEAVNFILLPGVKVKNPEGDEIEMTGGRFSNQWIGGDTEGDGFTVDFGKMLTLGSVTLFGEPRQEGLRPIWSPGILRDSGLKYQPMAYIGVILTLIPAEVWIRSGSEFWKGTPQGEPMSMRDTRFQTVFRVPRPLFPLT